MHCSMKHILFLSLLLLLLLENNITNAQIWSSNNRISKNVQQTLQPTVTSNNGLLLEQGAQIISKGSEKFALDFLKTVSAELSADNANFIISPFSVWSLMVLIAEGASGNTYTELQRALGLPTDISLIRPSYNLIYKSLRINTSTIDLAFSQALFSNKNQPIYSEFSEKLTKIYDANVHSIDFNELEKTFLLINGLIYNQTNGKITKIITMDDLTNAQMILISAIFFKGQWKIPFDRAYTKLEPFYNEAGKVIGNVSMMYQKSFFPFTAVPEINAFVLEMPYGVNNRLSMLLILPVRGVPLTSVIQKLAQVGTQQIFNALATSVANYEDDDVEVYLPRISITSQFIMNSILEKMNIRDLFDSTKANLSYASPYKLYLSKIIHHAKIEINEEGTIAAAASGASFVNKNSPPKFYANKPFAYLIVEKTTNVILFSGEIRNPVST